MPDKRTPDERVRHYCHAMEALWDDCTPETREAVREVLRLLVDDEPTVVPG
jgi:hypothetical protein